MTNRDQAKPGIVAVPTAFTLIELLVSIAIIAVLAALLVPSLRSAQARARSAYCMSNLRQWGVALTMFAKEHGGYPAYDTGAHSSHPWTDDWYGKLFLGDYVPSTPGHYGAPENGIMWCPEAEAESRSTGPLKYDWAAFHGGISYGMSIALWFDYGHREGSRIPAGMADLAMVRNPSYLIAVVDAASYERPWHLFGSSYAYPWDKSSSGWGDDSMAWPRHADACNVLWVDGHVSSVAVQNPERPESLYTPEALTTLGGDPDYWTK